MAAWSDSGSDRFVSFLIELVDGRSLRRHQDHVRIRKGNSESVLQPEEHEISALQEESLIDALTPAADEITALVPGQPEHQFWR